MQNERQQPPERHLPDLFTRAQWRRVSGHLALPPRQLQIARLMCLGCTNVEIAAHLGVSFDTVRMHTRALYRRLEVGSRMGVAVRLVLAHRKLESDGSNDA